MTRYETFRSVLESNNQSYTKQRSEVFNQLVKHSPVGAANLAGICQPTVDRATTYRCLVLFEKLGIIKRIWLGFKSKYELTDMFDPHHHHLTCLHCKRVFSVKSLALEKMLNSISHQHGVLPTDHQVEISGYCRNCRSYSSVTG